MHDTVDLEAVKAELRFQRGDRKAPGMVSHRHTVAGDRRGDRERPLMRHRQCPALAEIDADRVGYRRMVCDGEGTRVQHHSFRRNQAETGVGGADIGDEPSLADGVPCGHDRASRAKTASPIRASVRKASVVRRTSPGRRVCAKRLIQPRILSIANAFAKSSLTFLGYALDCAVR